MSFQALRQKVKKNKPLYACWHVVRSCKNAMTCKVRDIKARVNFKSERKLTHALVDGKINVGFVFAQVSSDWNKTEPIFLALKNDGRFNVTIIACPPWIGEKRVIFDDKSTNTNYQYFKTKEGYQNVNIIDAWLGYENYIDLRQFDFSYVFYNSPYFAFYPKSYHPKYVTKYTKICYTPYGYTLSKMFLPISSSWDEFRWFYCVYACSKGEKSYFDDRIKKKGTANLQRVAFCGFPRMHSFVAQKDANAPMWEFSKNKFRALWTPRWSTEDAIGGSNFLKYKDFMLELVKDNPDIDFVFRPHPLTFGNFIQTGQLTRTQADSYKAACNTNNSKLDESAEYASSFWRSSALITDFSSIIIEYLITELPIIFCTTKTNMEQPTEEFEKILSCCYIANSGEDIKRHLIQLKKGEDPLKEKRLIAIQEIFGDDIDKIPSRICDDLWQDHCDLYDKRKESREVTK